jgi:hypothetical protein
MRARQRAGLDPDPGAHLRDADDLLAPAVAETLAALDLGPEHAAAVKLAKRYAAAMDSARDPAYAARWLGPELLKCLAELGATPAARHALAKGQRQAPAGPSQLDRLRSVRP